MVGEEGGGWVFGFFKFIRRVFEENYGGGVVRGEGRRVLGL